MRHFLTALLLTCSLLLQASGAAAHGHRKVSETYRHYLAGPNGWTRTTYYYPTGYRTAPGLWPHWGTVGAPVSIPLGARVVVPGLGTFICADRGILYGAHLDIFLDYPGEHRVNDSYEGAYWIS